MLWPSPCHGLAAGQCHISPMMSLTNDGPNGESAFKLDGMAIEPLASAVERAVDLDELDMPDDYDPTAPSWIDYNFVADYGFDPLQFARFDLHLGGARDKARPLPVILRDYREAELRHGRLAMLAALAWPVQELLSPVLSRATRSPMLLAETAGRSPSVLNGGLEQSGIPLTIGASALLIAAVDLYSLRLREEQGEDWIPGDFGFDPLNLLGGATLQAKLEMQTKEINSTQGLDSNVGLTATSLASAPAHLPCTRLLCG